MISQHQLHSDTCTCISRWPLDTMLAGSLNYITDRCQCAEGSSSHYCWNTEIWPWLFSPLSLLCWLDILHCVQYKLRVAIYRCLWNQAPHYLMDCAYISVISVCDQPTNNQLVWPHYCHRKFGSCIFHRLPDEMELCLMRSIDSFTIALKTRSFAVHWH